MSLYQVAFSNQAKRSVRKLDSGVAKRIKATITALTENPWPVGCRPIVGYDGWFRVRVGTHRIVYSVDHDELSIVIIDLGPRGDVYKGL